MKKKLFFVMMIASTVVVANAQTGKGGIDARMLQQIEKGYEDTPANRAIRNAIGNNDISALVVNQDNQKAMDTNFSIRVKSKGITNQASSGRCWLFTGLNVMRAKAIEQYSLPVFEYSQVYSFFYDQLEKANLFLQGVIDTRHQPMDDKMVEWLFQHPLSDGGTFCGVADLVKKYGLVPKDVMPETYSSTHTSTMRSLISQKLKEYGLKLRDDAARGVKQTDLEAQKTEMLSTVYRMLVLNLGIPPKEFDFVRKDAEGKPVATEHHTPMSFYEKYDRHTYDGQNWVYVNLPIDEIKDMAIASLKDNTMMYFSCDVGKFQDAKRGLLDVNNFDYGSLMGTTFGMDKKQRIQTFASGSTHAMTLTAVDLDQTGKPVKWMVENSWGADRGYQGFLIMTDEWFNEYMFRLVVESRYATAKVKELLKQTPVKLPAWDPMFAEEE